MPKREAVNANRERLGLPPLKKRVRVRTAVTEKRRLEAEELRKQARERQKQNQKLKSSIRSMGKSQQTEKYLQKKKNYAEKLFEYLSNPDNPPIKKRKGYCGIVGYNSPAAFNKLFPPAELAEIESRALDTRRKTYANRLAMVDDGLLKRAAKGYASEAKLSYEKFEGWRSGTNIELTGKGGTPLIMLPPIQINNIADWETFISKTSENQPIEVQPQIEAPVE